MDDEDPIMDAVRTFNAKNPDKMAIALNPGDATIDAFFERQLRKHPYQKVAYETDFVGPYTRDQWPEQRAFLERCFRMGMFNMLTYSASKGGGDFFKLKILTLFMEYWKELTIRLKDFIPRH